MTVKQLELNITPVINGDITVLWKGELFTNLTEQSSCIIILPNKLRCSSNTATNIADIIFITFMFK